MKDGDDETSSAGGGDASGANGVDVDDGADANDGKVNEDESLVVMKMIIMMMLREICLQDLHDCLSVVSEPKNNNSQKMASRVPSS